MDCRIMQLADVARIYTGVNVKGEAFGEGGCPWVMVEDLENAPVETASRSLTREGMQSARLAPPQTVFFSRTGTIGKVGMATERMAPSNNIIAVEFQEELVFPLYGMYCLAAMRKRFEAAAETSVYRSLRLEDFRRFQIPVPDLTWQRRAARQLTRLQQSETAQRQAMEHIRAASQTIFERQFAQGIQEVIRQQAGVPLEHLAKLQLSGALKQRESGIACLYVATPQLQDWEVAWDAVPLAETAETASRCQLQTGDIVMNRINQEDRVGKCGLLAEAPPELAVFAQNTLLIRPDPERVNPAFLFAWLVSSYGKHYLRSGIKRSTSFQCTLNQASLRQMPVPVVPLEEQERFAEEYRLCLEYVRNGQRALAVLEQQRQVWYHRILLLLQEREGDCAPSLDGGREFWRGPSGEVYGYDPYLECIQVPLGEVKGVSLLRLPEGVEFQFLDGPREVTHPQYGELAHCRLRREGRNVKQIWMEPIAYRPEEAEAPSAEQMEREGLMSEQQDFGYARRAVVVSGGASRTVKDLLKQGGATANQAVYSRVDRLPAEAKRFLEQLSPFQQAVYEEFLLAMQPLTCHMAEQQLRLRTGGGKFPGRGLRDVAATVQLLENAGLLEYRQGRELAYCSESEEERQLMLDHRGHPIGIRTWLWTLPEEVEP